MSGSLPQPQARSEPLRGPVQVGGLYSDIISFHLSISVINKCNLYQDMKAETNVALNLRAPGTDGSLFGVPGLSLLFDASVITFSCVFFRTKSLLNVELN